MFFASSFLIIPKKKLNENNRQKKAENEFIIRPHIFIRDFEIQAIFYFLHCAYFGSLGCSLCKSQIHYHGQSRSSWATRVVNLIWEINILKKFLPQKHTFESPSLRLTKQYFIRFILILFLLKVRFWAACYTKSTMNFPWLLKFIQ